MKHFINLKDISAKDLRKILIDAKKRKRARKNKTKKVYDKDDFASGDGMLTSVWGPSLWHYLHTMSFNYPVKPTRKDKKHYRQFVMNLRNVLPCKYCRDNLKDNYKKLKLNKLKVNPFNVIKDTKNKKVVNEEMNTKSTGHSTTYVHYSLHNIL